MRLALVGTALIAVLVSGAGAIAVFRSVALEQTRGYLLRSATSLAVVLIHVPPTRLVRLARVSGITHLRLVPLYPSAYPSPKDPHLDMKLLLAGHYQFGEFHGSAFIAYPIYRVFAGQIHAYALVLTRALPSIIAPSLFVALVAIGAAALAIAIADRYTARIAKTLSALVTAADEIAAGHLDVDLGTEEPRERELRDLKIALAQMASALKDLDDKQSAFLLSISHDLKTPLTSIRGFAEAIIDNAVSDPTVAARTIVSESSRIERLINDLIALARMRAPDFTVTATEVDLHELIGRLVESAQPTLQNAALELEFRSQSGSIPVMTDPQRLLQLLGNLVDNAIKYASTKVVISLTEEPTVVIEDDGPGIPPDIADSIFKEQVTPSPGRQGQIGSGLGLLIVFRLSQLLGLSISCQSPLDSSGGSRFTLRFR